MCSFEHTPKKNPHEFRLQGVKIGSNSVLRGTVGHWCEAILFVYCSMSEKNETCQIVSDGDFEVMVDKTRFVELLKAGA